MDGIITAINSPLAIKLISTTLGIVIGREKKDADTSGQIPPIGWVSAFCKHKEFSTLVPIC